jgi:hypothetical protein
MGAGALLGAIWGGTAKADDPGFRIRARADFGFERDTRRTVPGSRHD